MPIVYADNWFIRLGNKIDEIVAIIFNVNNKYGFHMIQNKQWIENNLRTQIIKQKKGVSLNKFNE